MPDIHHDPQKVRELNRLRDSLRVVAQGGARLPPLPFGLAAVDAALHGGLHRGVVHEVIEAPDDAGAVGFCAALLGRLAEGGDRPALWCGPADGRDGTLHASGLLPFGLDPGRVIRLDLRRRGDLPWAMEEGLRSGALCAVLGELDGIAPTAWRRLQLAAEAGGVTGLVLRHPRPAAGLDTSGSAVTCWQVRSAPGAWAQRVWARWRVGLLRCRGGVPGEWLMDWQHETHRFALVAELRDGSSASAAG